MSAAMPDGRKHCPKCDTVKTVEDFGKSGRQKDGLQSWCRGCKKVDAANYLKKNRARVTLVKMAWRAKNPDKVRAYVRAFQKRNPEATKANFKKWRAANRETVLIWAKNCYAKRKGAAGSYTKDDIDDIARMQRGKCAYCRRKLGKKFHVDHIIPICAGGSNDKRNLQLTCGSCNCSKHAKHPIEYARSIGRLL